MTSLREAAQREAEEAEAEYERLLELADGLYERRAWIRDALDELGYLNPLHMEEEPMAKTKIELTEPEMAEMREALTLREEDLERARKYLDGKGLSTGDVEDRQKIVKGDGPTRPGLKAKLGFRDEADPDQKHLELADDG